MRLQGSDWKPSAVFILTRETNSYVSDLLSKVCSSLWFKSMLLCSGNTGNNIWFTVRSHVDITDILVIKLSLRRSDSWLLRQGHTHRHKPAMMFKMTQWGHQYTSTPNNWTVRMKCYDVAQKCLRGNFLLVAWLEAWKCQPVCSDSNWHFVFNGN